MFITKNFYLSKLLGLCIVAALYCACSATAEDKSQLFDVKAPRKIEMSLIYFFDNENPKYIFRIGDTGFRSVESLRNYLGTFPKGSEVTWAPGCDRFGDEPLLSSNDDLKTFSKFLLEKGIKFILRPSG